MCVSGVPPLGGRRRAFTPTQLAIAVEVEQLVEALGGGTGAHRAGPQRVTLAMPFLRRNSRVCGTISLV